MDSLDCDSERQHYAAVATDDEAGKSPARELINGQNDLVFSGLMAAAMLAVPLLRIYPWWQPTSRAAS